jgi:hypothetical protein
MASSSKSSAMTTKEYLDTSEYSRPRELAHGMVRASLLAMWS